MSTPAAGSPTPQHAPEEAVRWFTQWHIYRSIVDADWMAHRGIFATIRAWVMQRYPGPFTLVDLGCGDVKTGRDHANEGVPWTAEVQLLPMSQFQIGEQSCDGCAVAVRAVFK